MRPYRGIVPQARDCWCSADENRQGRRIPWFTVAALSPFAMMLSTGHAMTCP